MLIATPGETWPGELRAALVPAGVKKLVGAGFEVAVEAGLGLAAGYPDGDYAAAGAAVRDDRAALLGSADVVSAGTQARRRRNPAAQIRRDPCQLS